jgi:hypothetical protein
VLQGTVVVLIATISGLGPAAAAIPSTSNNAVDRYTVELKAWIPQDRLPATPNSPVVCGVGEYMGSRKYYKGDSHVEYNGSYRVLVSYSFAWDGTRIADISTNVDYGYTHLMQSGCPDLIAHAAKAGDVTAASPMSFQLHMSSANPIEPFAPAIDAYLRGNFSNPDELSIDLTSDKFPSYGFRIIKNGQLVATAVDFDASCVLGDTKVAVGLTAGASGDWHRGHHDIDLNVSDQTFFGPCAAQRPPALSYPASTPDRSLGVVDLSFAENSLIRPDPFLPPGGGARVTTEISYTVRPHIVQSGDTVSLAIVEGVYFPAINYLPSGPQCHLPQAPPTGAPFSYTFKFADPTNSVLAFPDNSRDTQPFVHESGFVFPIVVSTPSRTRVTEGPCETIDSLTDVVQFKVPSSGPYSSGRYYISLGLPRVVSIEANSSNIPLSAVDYRVEGELPVLSIRPRPGPSLDSLVDTNCRVPDRGGPSWPFSTVKLYAQYERTICAEAVRFGISRTLLAITLQHEGYNRAKYIQSGADKIIEMQFGGDSVGLGQMHPSTAQLLAGKYDGETISLDTARHRLIYNGTWAVHMAAAYLYDLQSQFELTDRQAFILYVLGADKYREAAATQWRGAIATARGHTYDRLYEEIAGQYDYY